MHSERKSVTSARTVRAFSSAALAAAGFFSLAGCGSTYRPVVSAINPVGPAGQPQKYAVAISSNGATSQGLVTLIDFSGDTIVNTTLIGVNPKYFILDQNGFEGYTLNSDGTLNSFSVSSSLLASQVLSSTLLTNPASNPVSIYPQGSYLYIAEAGRNAIAQLQGLPPAIKQELPTTAPPIYTVGASSSPRAYGLVPSATAGANGTALPIETNSNTTDSPLPVGVNPTYGVMTSDSRRAFILNKGSNNVTVINAQSNALDTFTTASGVTSTIPVGVAPVWADFAPTLTELLVLNQGNGTTTNGSVTIVSIPLCSVTTVTTNPLCDSANPIDAAGFGTVLATIPVGINPVMITVLQDGSQAYVANAGNPALPCNTPTTAAPVANCSISVINLSTFSVTGTIPSIVSTSQTDAYVHGRPLYIGSTTGTPTGKVYVVAGDSSDISIIRTDTDTLQTHLPLQGNGVSVRMTAQ